MKRKKAEYELPIAGVAWTKGAGAPAGIFFLGGTCHIAAESSPAEEDLLERGALHIASIRFDGTTMEASLPWRPVRAMSSWEAVTRLVATHRN